MTNIVSWIVFGIICGMMVNKLSTNDCKEGYVKVTVILAPSVCVMGYQAK